jgi:hypothetical protein
MLAAMSAVAGCAPVEKVRSPSGTMTTVILLRHAERYGPDLIAEGRARAAALPAAVSGYDIAAIYSPDLVRNIDTVRPLAKQRGLKIKVIEVKNVARRLVHENPGKTVVWVGNSTNLHDIYESLGGTDRAPVAYGQLYILDVPAIGKTKVIKTRYGK